jgi:hypothetical protein
METIALQVCNVVGFYLLISFLIGGNCENINFDGFSSTVAPQFEFHRNLVINNVGRRIILLTGDNSNKERSFMYNIFRNNTALSPTQPGIVFVSSGHRTIFKWNFFEYNPSNYALFVASPYR